MRNIFKKFDNFYNNNKWFRIAFTIFEYVIMFLIAFLSLIGLMVLAKKPVIYSNEYDLSNNEKISMVEALQVDNDIINLASPDLTNKQYLDNGDYKINNFIIYNVFSGIYTLNGTFNSTTELVKITSDNFVASDLVLQYIFISGSLEYSLQFDSTGVYNWWGNLGSSNSTMKKTSYNTNNIRLVALSRSNAINVKFKIQLEKGTNATTYQTPISALKQHDNFNYDEGYNEGLDEGLKSVFDNENLILNSQFLARGATAPDNRFFGYKIELENDFYFSNLDIFGLEQFGSLADLDLTSNVGNVRQGIRLEGKNGVNTSYRFQDFQDNYNLLTTIKGNKNSETKYDTIIIVLATNNLSMPEHEFNHLQENIYSKIGVYLNNMVLSSEAMEHYFNKYYTEGYYDAKEEQKDLIEQSYNKGKNEGYNEGLNANPNNHWSDLLFTIFGAFGTILAIEILPGWSIGIIIGIPIVFGIIYFIIGRKKD